MLYLILATAIMLALLDKTIRGGRIRLLRLELEFKLFALRDQLRIDAIRGESPYNRWFDYMDTTLTRTIGALSVVNPWYVVGFVCFHRNDKDLFSAYELMRRELRKPENQKIERVYDQYNSCLIQFVQARYPASWKLAAILIAFFTRQKDAEHTSVEEEQRQLTPVFSISPATSTLQEFSPTRSTPTQQGSVALTI